MRLTQIEDCKNCANSILFGSKDAPEVKCNSSDYTHLKHFREHGRYNAKRCNGFCKTDKIRNGKLEQSKALQFMLAGNSEFIMHSTKTSEDFHLILTKKQSDKEIIYFVNVKKAHENIYAGFVKYDEDKNEYVFIQGNKGNLTNESLTVRSLLFVLNKLNKEETVGNLEFYHVGKCGTCASNLITTEQLLSGYCKLHFKEEETTK